MRRADHSSRGVLPTVACRCGWSRNLVKRGGHSPGWAAEPEKERERERERERDCWDFNFRFNSILYRRYVMSAGNYRSGHWKVGLRHCSCKILFCSCWALEFLFAVTSLNSYCPLQVCSLRTSVLHSLFKDTLTELVAARNCKLE
jgi:hypothetical protein